jgi:heat shock protein HslJ
MRHRSILIAVSILGVLVVGAIVAVIILSARSTPPAALTQPTWTLTTLVVDGQEQALSASHPATLHFGAHDGQIAGSGGCNTFGGSYALNGTQLHIGALRSTLIGCLEPVVSEQESHYFQALPRVATYGLKGNTLTLSGESGRVQLIFRAS